MTAAQRQPPNCWLHKCPSDPPPNVLSHRLDYLFVALAAILLPLLHIVQALGVVAAAMFVHYLVAMPAILLLFALMLLINWWSTIQSSN